MKNRIKWILLAALCAPFCAARAQDKPQNNVNAEHHAKAPVSARVQVVFMEFDGDKKVASLPYSFVVIVEESNAGRYSVNLRTGVRVPVEIDGKDQKTTYFDVGTNIDCGVHYDEEGKYRVLLNFERSSLYPNKSAEGERLVSQPDGQPLVRQLRISDQLVLKDGQTSEIIISTDPLNGHVAKISVTLNLQP